MKNNSWESEDNCNKMRTNALLPPSTENILRRQDELRGLQFNGVNFQPYQNFYSNQMFFYDFSPGKVKV